MKTVAHHEYSLLPEEKAFPGGRKSNASKANAAIASASANAQRRTPAHKRFYAIAYIVFLNILMAFLLQPDSTSISKDTLLMTQPESDTLYLYQNDNAPIDQRIITYRHKSRIVHDAEN